LRASVVKLTKFLLVALTQIATVAHQPTAITPEIVVVQSGALQLKALLWLPDNGGPFPAVLFNHGSGSFDAMHTGPFVITEAAERLGPIFAKHGYAAFLTKLPRSTLTALRSLGTPSVVS
jgi:hypothetical protein